MDFKTQQDAFDGVKWYDSILAGCDRCGSYEFCHLCNKAEAYPCARAMDRLAHGCTSLEADKKRGKFATVRIKVGG